MLSNLAHPPIPNPRLIGVAAGLKTLPDHILPTMLITNFAHPPNPNLAQVVAALKKSAWSYPPSNATLTLLILQTHSFLRGSSLTLIIL